MSKLQNSNFSKQIQNEKGQGLMEYLILVALITVASIGVVRVVGTNVSNQYAKINTALGANEVSVTMERIDADDLKKKDLSNFMNGARNDKSGK